MRMPASGIGVRNTHVGFLISGPAVEACRAAFDLVAEKHQAGQDGLVAVQQINARRRRLRHG